jgi:glycosyltransferase involved in cell wall biosynthesis
VIILDFYYVTLECLEKSLGVKKKILGQVKAFKSFGFNVSLIKTVRKGVLSRVFEMQKSLKINKNAVYYFRGFGFLFVFFKRKLRKLKKNGNILVLEIPTPIITSEKEFVKSKDNMLVKKIKCFLFNHSFPSVLDYFDLIVEYAPEDLKYTQGIENKFVYISNGVDVESIKLKNKNESNDINLISVANISNWHGFDRVIKGLYEYYYGDNKLVTREVFYYCVGEGDDLENLKKLVSELNLEKYVIFPGAKSGKELNNIFDKSDIAIGSLANHRKGLFYDAALKNREYCARGIPFILASPDPDFPEMFPYVFRVSSDEGAVNIKEIISWYERLIQENPDYSIEMRKYAEEHLSWEAKLMTVLERINKLSYENK